MKNRAAARLVLANYEEDKVIAAAREARAEIGAGNPVSVAVVFVSADYAEHLEEFLELVRVYGQAPLLVGCTGGGLIGTGREEESKSGFSLLLLSLPNTVVTPFEFSQGQVEESSGPGYWQMETGLSAEDVDAWIVLANPFRLDLDRWLGEWNVAYPGVPALGGMASATDADGDSADNVVLFRDGHAIAGDGLALGLRGGVRVQTVVSQGCRPIGEPLTVTGVKGGNLLMTLGSKPAYEVLNGVFQGLTEKERSRANGNLFAGLAMSEYLDEYKRGDFLIRPILGADREAGAVAIGGNVRVGQTLQYQLRDRDSADEDLRELCQVVRLENETAAPVVRPFATLLFACNGRGKGLFKAPNHDAGLLVEIFGALPGAGFFCNGEIGPVGKQNFVHGYTASVALLCEE